jgi:hypothetical protein
VKGLLSDVNSLLTDCVAGERASPTRSDMSELQDDAEIQRYGKLLSSDELIMAQNKLLTKIVESCLICRKLTEVK